MAAELAVVDPRQADGPHRFGPDDARRWLAESELLVAPLVLRPFLDAYRVVAECLATRADDEPFDQAGFLDEVRDAVRRVQVLNALHAYA